MKKLTLLSILTVFALGCLYVQWLSKGTAVEASGNSIPNFATMASSSGILVNTSDTMLVATNTARLYLRIANISSKPISCNLKNGAPAVLYTGVTIFASTTLEIDEDKFPYTGAVRCISETPASTTVTEK